MVRRLRRAERSRRLLLLRALVEETMKSPELAGPLPPPDDAWELLARVQENAPAALDVVLAHPYTGTWAGYTTRLVRNRITGACPTWMHVGHLHALAAAAAIRAGLDFQTRIPLWNGGAILPTLGLARLAADSPWSVARVCREHGRVEVSGEGGTVRLPTAVAADAPGWWGIPRLTVRAGGRELSVHLDDLDPYRGLYEPVPPQRIEDTERSAWRALLDEAWRLIAAHLPDTADALSAGLDAIVPGPLDPFRISSSSTGEAFGSAIISRPPDAAGLAATLLHEFHHIRLGGLLHLTRLHDADPRERFYTPWRDDPRPIAGVMQGAYAFFGVTACWRAIARAGTGAGQRRASFEFAHWREQTWRVLRVLRAAAALTPAGRRFTDGIAERLGPWRDEPVPADLGALARAVGADHYAGWRLRHLRPDPRTVTGLAEDWLAGGRPATPWPVTDRPPTPVPDGSWSRARADLVRLRLSTSSDARDASSALSRTWSSVPDATAADFAYASGRFVDAARAYRAELAANADRPASWVGLGLALSELGTIPAARALLRYPEVVRAVYRRIPDRARTASTPEDLASWIGRFTYSAGGL
ncbi:HEXXH motif domain-containing protein [Pseudonocardia acaciae]|uniref:HEXXH motif domain-containing protein n=1 Tax=Pseudonocardia acaciae TaxID=551276 RepID=UPI001FDEF47A|nr:HEXXH motif domain-containing protein [Pseudonocardia acaciae]